MNKRVYYYENDNLHDRASTARYLFAVDSVAGKVVAVCEDSNFKIETNNETPGTVDAILGMGAEKEIRA